MEKLIITCATNRPGMVTASKKVGGIAHSTDSSGGMIVSGLKAPETAQETIDSGREAVNAGAAVLHVHQPYTKKYQERIGMHGEVWLDLVPVIHQEMPDVIVEHGTGGLPYITMDHHYPPLRTREIDDQLPYLGMEKPDMIVMALGSQHHPRGSFELGGGIYAGTTREDLARWMRLCRENGVKPCFEAGGRIGDLYNLKWLADRGLIDPPAYLGIRLGLEGARWTPVTLEELLHKVETIREVVPGQEVMCFVADDIHDSDIRQQLAWGITLGLHIRTGFEVSPYYSEGVPAKSNAQLVERVVRIARELGREIASPAEARQILGLPPGKR